MSLKGLQPYYYQILLDIPLDPRTGPWTKNVLKRFGRSLHRPLGRFSVIRFGQFTSCHSSMGSTCPDLQR
jgi:hypothetical protein